jgi:SAM-dependent methyltransferase
MVVRDWLARGGRRPGRYVAVEPSPVHVASLRQTVAALQIEDVDVLDRPFDAGFPIPGAFDLVVFSHSLYWIPEPAACVRHAAGALAPGGAVLAFLQSPMGVHPLFTLFDPLLARDRPNPCDHALSSHELTLALRDLGLAPRVDLDPTVHDLSGLFDAGNERERDDFLSFCLQAEVGPLPDPLKSDLVAYLRAACVVQGDRLHWPQPTAAVWVRRPR